MGGAQPLAATMNGARFLGIEVDAARIERRLQTGYCDRMAGTLEEALEMLSGPEAISVALVGNCADVLPEMARRGIVPHVLTDQTSAHDPLNGYVPNGMPLAEARLLLARQRIQFQGLPARICWLGYGDRAEFGLAINRLVRNGELIAPIVIGRDHLDTGSVASPFRETEGMRDGSDAIADWPLLNALVNTAAGASWVSIHNGGGVGIGYSQHAGMVVVADGTAEMDRRLERVLTSDPGLGVVRHADASHPEAIPFPT